MNSTKNSVVNNGSTICNESKLNKTVHIFENMIYTTNKKQIKTTEDKKVTKFK